jgi:flavin reductase (DIM6/NTAB) family NADH-FMN oxidoreductase RutF
MIIESSGSTCSTAHACGLPILFRRAAGYVPYGVALLSAGRITKTVSSLQVVSIDPPHIAVSLSNSSGKGAILLEADAFRVRLLRGGEEPAATSDCVFKEPGLVELQCAVTERLRLGDHTLVIAEVSHVLISDGHPIVYWRRGLHRFRPQYRFLSCRREFAHFVSLWEAGALPRTEWNHAAHVAIGAYYATGCGSTAFERIKCGILRYNAATGLPNTAGSGYHETLTRLWAGIVLKAVEGFQDSFAAARFAVEKFGEERDLHHLYYSFDVVRDVTARQSWIAPDLRGPYELSELVVPSMESDAASRSKSAAIEMMVR